MARSVIRHVEWHVTNLARAKEFYGALFGWTFQDAGATYTFFHTGGNLDGGLEERMDARGGTSPVIYVEVQDIDATLAKAELYGGSLRTPRTALSDGGWYAICSDPDGNPVGLYEPR